MLDNNLYTQRQNMPSVLPQAWKQNRKVSFKKDQLPGKETSHCYTHRTARTWSSRLSLPLYLMRCFPLSKSTPYPMRF